jgi:hypothetical protein
MAQRCTFPVLAANFQEADGSLVAGFRATASFALNNRVDSPLRRWVTNRRI